MIVSDKFACLLGVAFAIPGFAAESASSVSPPTALETGSGFVAAITTTRPLVDVRFRNESVEQSPPPAILTHDADALTVRARIGFETGGYAETKLLAEGTFTRRLSGDFRTDNAAPVRNITYPVIADPNVSSINRLQLSNTSLPDTTIIIGRQRINLDDQRFVGNSNWRQTEQTLDAVRLVNRGIEGLTADATWFDRVHRVNGPDSVQGTYTGSGVLGNLSLRVRTVQLVGFAYSLRLDPIKFPTGPGVTAATATALNPARSDTNTYGARVVGGERFDEWRFDYQFSYATQSEAGVNPLRLSNGYYFGELSAGVHGLSLAAGDEVLKGNGTIGFSTPLATLHIFQGWADKFLITPANGVADRYLRIQFDAPRSRAFDAMTLSAIWHDFHTDRLDQHYGIEWDLLASATHGRFTALLKYSHYRTGQDSAMLAGYGDTNKFWAQLEYRQ